MLVPSLFSYPGLRMGCLWGLGLALSSAAWADPCEPLRERIESQIRAKGVRDFVLTVVPVGAEVQGKAVGWCDTGQRKVVYRRGVHETSSADVDTIPTAAADRPGVSSVTAQPARARVRVQMPARGVSIAPTIRKKVITECRDGLVIVQGDCPG